MARLDYMDVYFSVQSFQEEDLRGKSAVIIDVLRAASSMVTALSNGAKKLFRLEQWKTQSELPKLWTTKIICFAENKTDIRSKGFI